jgi:hypothetical protein
MKVQHRGTGQNPITTATIVGLGWGLAFGLVDGLPALLEGDPLAPLGRRLLTLLYVSIFDALVFGLLLTIFGILVWAFLRLARRQASQASLLGLYVGLCAALSTGAYGLHHYQDTSPALVAVLALVAGGVAGWLVRVASATSVADAPTVGSGIRKATLAVFGVGIVLLLGAVVFRHTLRDSPALNPRLTDQVATPERPNIVLISIDALRADGLGIYGNGPAVSPRIDALAGNGHHHRSQVGRG